VVVFGAGAVGLLAAQVAAATGGLVTVLGAPGDEERLAIARSLGFETGISGDPELEAELDRRTRDRSVDVVIEAAGAGPAVHRGLRLVRSGGRYVQMGLLGGDVSVPFGEIVVREIAVRGSFGTSPGSWLRLEQLLAGGFLKLDPLITSVLPLSRADEAMARFRDRQGIKTIFDPRL
jgi:L-iditol 2-dehydrogenase